MKIIVDNRESDLIPLLQILSTNYKFSDTIEVAQLDIGDVVIQTDKGEELLVLERKSISDLASSIKDGRYAEQSFRLNHHSLHNHNIIYIIEGLVSEYNPKYTRVSKGTIHSSIFSLNYYKGFSVIRTVSLSETAEFILRVTDKLRREDVKYGYYNTHNIAKEQNYTYVIKKTKKGNITPDNITAIMLSQIPSVSIKTSDTIVKEYKTMSMLISALEKDKTCLDGLSSITKNGKERKISKTAIANIITYLLYKEL